MDTSPRKSFLNQLRRLEGTIETLREENRLLREQVELQGDQTFEMAGATMRIRKEDAEALAAFRKTNKELVEFMEEIAEAKRTKFSKKAQQILGLC
jgi:hypothetical protein